MNVPNVLTLFRVVFAIAVFVLLPFGQYDLCLLFFILASLTDFVDGWWARKFKQVTVFGRIMDPFADKFLICGTFICLLGVPELQQKYEDIPHWLSFQPWMVVVIVGRELLITSIRAFVEKSGGDFSAKWIGKWKMGVQCIAIIAVLMLLSIAQGEGSPFIQLYLNIGLPLGLNYALKPFFYFVFYIWLISLWATVFITLYSGVTYCYRAAKMIKGHL